MGLRYRKSIKLGKGVKINLSKSGVSTSVKVGNTTYNTKRGTTVNLGNGLTYHSSNKKSTNKTNNKNLNQSKEVTIIENKWDKMTDKQIKNYNILMKVLSGILAILSLILGIVIPPILIITVISLIIVFKFDAKKMQSKYKSNKHNEVEQDIVLNNENKEELEIIDAETLDNSPLLDIEQDKSIDIIEDKPIKVNYEVIESNWRLKKYNKFYSTNYSQDFNSIDIEGYKILHEDLRVVGAYYRQDNIDTVFNEIKDIEEPELDISLDKDPDNVYDSNAIKVCVIYKVEDEIRKIHIGYLSREYAEELKDIDDLKASLTHLDRLSYKNITINLMVNEVKYNHIIKEKEEKRKLQEEYNKELEKIEKKSKIAYEYNQLAMQLEKEGNINEAIENYEKAIELQFEGNYPYDRLAILYRKRKDYDNEIRVLEQAINLFEFLEKATSRSDVIPKLEKFKTRINRANELNNKSVNKNK